MHLLAIGEEVAIKEILQFSIPTESASQFANKEKYMFRYAFSSGQVSNKRARYPEDIYLFKINS